VHGVERTNGFHRERPLHALEYILGNRNHVATTLELPKCADRCAFSIKGDPAAYTRAHNRTRRFRKRQGGGDLLRGALQRLQQLFIMLKERREQRA
jgi:hypothetical protein